MGKDKKQERHVNKYAHLNEPEKTFDFHEEGILNGAEIRKKTIDFIQSCIKEGVKKALIITGKGLHSENGKALVKPTVEKFLRTLRDEETITSFNIARRDRGGDGAFEVIISKNK
jgi:DNA-nicking Smr family endonuclease